MFSYNFTCEIIIIQETLTIIVEVVMRIIKCLA